MKFLVFSGLLALAYAAPSPQSTAFNDAVLLLQQQQAALAQPVVPQVPGLAEHIAAEAALVALQEQQAAANAGWNMNMNMEDWMRF